MTSFRKFDMTDIYAEVTSNACACRNHFIRCVFSILSIGIIRWPDFNRLLMASRRSDVKYLHYLEPWTGAIFIFFSLGFNLWLQKWKHLTFKIPPKQLVWQRSISRARFELVVNDEKFETTISSNSWRNIRDGRQEYGKIHVQFKWQMTSSFRTRMDQTY